MYPLFSRDPLSGCMLLGGRANGLTRPRLDRTVSPVLKSVWGTERAKLARPYVGMGKLESPRAVFCKTADPECPSQLDHSRLLVD